MSQQSVEVPDLSKKDIRRFLGRVHKRGPDECWYFGKNQVRPNFSVNDKSYVAARVAWKIKTGKDPGDFLVCHTCDNPLCVNPRHLFLGTEADNMIDKENKGRGNQAKGAAHCRHTAKLTVDDISDIRFLLKQGFTHRELAISYCVHHTQITAINTGRNWSHIL